MEHFFPWIKIVLLKCVFCKWSGRRDSNSRRSPWQGDALPLSHSRILGSCGASGRNRTTDTWIFSPLLYRLSYRGMPKLPIYKTFSIRENVATGKGFEPSTSSVTGWHSNQLNYPAKCGGSYRARTYDPLLVRQMLSQLS